MSRFFHRLASSVIRPPAEQKLRPLTGSVFAPRVQPGGFDVAQSPEFEFEQSETSQPRESSSHNQTDSSAPAREFEPLLPPVKSNLGTSPGVESRIDLNSSQLENREVQSASVADSPSPNRRDSNQASRENEFTPQVKTRSELNRGEIIPPPRNQVQPAVTGITPLRPVSPAPQQAVSARASTGDRAQRQAQPKSEPDEIHIHIGRVEVAAFSQPAVRQAPPAPPRKSVNLDEYLRRANGRAR